MNKILIAVKDSKLNNFLVNNLLSKYFSFITVKTEEEFYTYIKNEETDIIICQTDFSHEIGYKIIEEVKRKIKTKFPIFIFISLEYVTPRDIRKGMELGADDFIVFPIIADELNNSLLTQLDKRKNLIKYLANKISGKSNIIRFPINEEKQNNNKEFSDYIFLDDKSHPGFYPLKNVMYIKSFGDYTKICILPKRKIVVHKTLTFWEKNLPKPNFIRIHRQTIINIDYIERFERDNGYSYRVYLKNVPVSFKVSQRYSQIIRQTWGVN